MNRISINGVATFCVLLLGLNTSCVKNPDAEFILNKSEYRAGEVVSITNKSSNAEHYVWTMPDGTLRSGKEVRYQIPQNCMDGRQLIALNVQTADGTSQAYCAKTFLVRTPTGRLSIWTSCKKARIIHVQVDHEPAGILAFYCTTDPGCDAANSLSLDLTEGEHVLDASDGKNHWHAKVTILKGQCLSYQLP